MDSILKAVDELVRRLGDKIVGVALFGSAARDESKPRSDLDFLVVVRNFPDRDRRFKIYDPLHSVLKTDITLIDLDEEALFGDLNLTPLLLNIIWDAQLLYDPSGKLQQLFERVKRGIQGKLIRYRTPDGKYGWKPVSGKLKAFEIP